MQAPLRTAFGCLAWIVGYAVLLLLERQWLQGLPALPRDTAFGWPLAGALALIVVLAVGSLLSLLLQLGALAKARRGTTGTAPESAAPLNWQPGQQVQITGVLEASGQPLLAPFSQRQAVFVCYEAFAGRFATGVNDERVVPRLSGLQHVPALLRVGAQRIPLHGFPAPPGVDEVQFRGPQASAAAAGHLQRTRWQSSGLPEGGLTAALHLFSDLAPGTGADAGRHMMNARAREMLADYASMDARTLGERVEEQAWFFRERVWPPGQTYTATGTWRNDPPRLDIGYGPLNPDHQLQAGTADQLSWRALQTALAFTVVLAVLAIGAHITVSEQGGGRVAGWWQALQSD